MSYPNQGSNVVIVAENKSLVVSYVLWFFLGNLGVHRLYLGAIGTGLIQLGLTIAGWATVWFLIGYVFLIPLWIWLIVDLFWIYKRVGNANYQNAASISNHVNGAR